MNFHTMWRAMGGRRGGGSRFGHGRGGGFGRGGFMGGEGFPGGRKLSTEELQLILLALLEERPAHGYELIRLLEERSDGFYTPSPGMIYPALTYLEELGHASVTQEGNRKRYALTDSGREHLAANRDDATSILDALGRIGQRMKEVREAFAGVDDVDPDAAEELHRARHGIKHALMKKRGCSREEALRIAAILDRATAEILKAK